MTKFKAAVYCRISHDDINRQSESVENQQLIIENYIQAHSEEFEIAEVYIDDGISGMTYDRAAYSKMMEDVGAGCINAIIVKDLSRIGREQIDTLNLIKREFILKNIRFIAVTDDYDSFNPLKSDGLSTSVKLLLNDYYCADISKKVRSAQKVKMAKGDFIGSYAPYGYKKAAENKNRLVIDEEAAEVVRRIFSLYIGGMGKLSIARLLNSEGVPNPSQYKKQSGHNYVNSNRLKNTIYWTYSTIHKILKSPVYAGDTVSHRSEMKAYNIHKKVQVPEEEWIVVKNTHEAIIDRDTFEGVSKMLKNKRRQMNMTENISKYAGLFFCKDCGRAMHKFISKKKDVSRYYTFKCGSYSALGKKVCTIHSIKESELDAIVLGEIRRNIKAALDTKSCEYIKNKSLSKMRTKQKNNLDKLTDSLEKCALKRKTMLRHLAEGIISSEDFISFDEENKAEEKALGEQAEAIKIKLKDEENQLKEYNRWIENLLKYKDIFEINREILVNLVDRIYISEDKADGTKEIEIKFKFKNPMEL